MRKYAKAEFLVCSKLYFYCRCIFISIYMNWTWTENSACGNMFLSWIIHMRGTSWYCLEASAKLELRNLLGNLLCRKWVRNVLPALHLKSGFFFLVIITGNYLKSGFNGDALCKEMEWNVDVFSWNFSIWWLNIFLCLVIFPDSLGHDNEKAPNSGAKLRNKYALSREGWIPKNILGIFKIKFNKDQKSKLLLPDCFFLHIFIIKCSILYLPPLAISYFNKLFTGCLISNTYQFPFEIQKF